MARGWESKSVESQQAQASQDDKRRPARPPTAEELEKRAARKTLELARARAEADLANAKNDRHREMLQRALSSIDERLEALGRRAG